MIAFFRRLFERALASDLAEARNLAAGLREEIVPEETCRRLRVRLPVGAWQFTTGQVLRRRIVQEESEYEYAGHSGYIERPIVVYGWRQHDGKVKVHRLDSSLEKGQIDLASDDELIRSMRDSGDVRFVVAYRPGSSSHGLFALPGNDRYSQLRERESARPPGRSPKRSA